jgi:hypothetical protein
MLGYIYANDALISFMLSLSFGLQILTPHWSGPLGADRMAFSD